MARVTEEREARRVEEQRRAQERQETRRQQSAQQFSKLVARRTPEPQAKKPLPTHRPKTHDSPGRQKAKNSLLASDRLKARRFAKTLAHQGKESIRQGESLLSDRISDFESDAVIEEQDAQLEFENQEQRRDLTERISGDDTNESGGSGADSEGFGGSDSQQDPGSSSHHSPGPASARTSGRASASEAAPVLPPEIIDQIVQRTLVGINQDGLSEFHIQFKDGVLGGISLRLTAEGTKIRAAFTTTDKNVGRLLKASEGELARAFENKGLNLDQLDVEVTGM